MISALGFSAIKIINFIINLPVNPESSSSAASWSGSRWSFMSRDVRIEVHYGLVHCRKPAFS